MSIKNKVMIRNGNEFYHPCVVWVSHKKLSTGMWVTHELNTGNIHFSEEKDLYPFNNRTFEIMLYEWQIKECDETKARYKQLLEELQ